MTRPSVPFGRIPKQRLIVAALAAGHSTVPRITEATGIVYGTIVEHLRALVHIKAVRATQVPGKRPTQYALIVPLEAAQQLIESARPADVRGSLPHEPQWNAHPLDAVFQIPLAVAGTLERGKTAPRRRITHEA